MLNHSGCCAGPHSLEDAPRAAPHTTHCLCGYHTHIGTDMLTHLLMCERKTAYSSEEEARANIVNAEENAHKLTAPADNSPLDTVSANSITSVSIWYWKPNFSPISLPTPYKERMGRGGRLDGGGDA
ncbi:hypothetical protein RR48_00189 [Papilio machaon]|uniref:Uncharacterized protein n=1 Tax=Papilio machaon TaxID=76193 RepID=A0A0N1PKJ1_PAPMA|nr:hypothetical protein RR48_00189 [Papilio machaon]